MNETWDDVAVVQVEVVVLAKNVGWNHSGEVATMLRLVHSVLHVHHPFSVGVSLVGEVGWPVVNHRLVDGERRLVWEDARREA